MVPDIVKNRAKDGPIKWPALNLTLYSGATLSVGAILSLWGGIFKQFFGYSPQDHPGASAAIFAALVGAIALIFAADLLTRGIAASHPGDSAPLPEAIKVQLNQAGSEPVYYRAVAIRIASNGPEALILKEDTDPTWHPLGSDTNQVKLLSATQ
ncbi:MAG: hypothetical protein ACTHN7_00505 [Solirubrobacterales bacterium]